MFANQVAVAVGFGGEPEATLGALEKKKNCILYIEDPLNTSFHRRK